MKSPSAFGRSGHAQVQVWGVLVAGLGEKSGRLLWVQVDTEKFHLISRS